MSPSLRRKLPLIILIVVCATPAVGPYLLWFFWQPGQFSNYGELIEPRPLPVLPLDTLGAPVAAAAPAQNTPVPAQPTLRGKWFLVIADAASCDQRCERKLYHLRQLRTMQGKDMERVERVWLVDDGADPAARLAEPFAGTLLVRRPDAALLQSLPVPAGGNARDHIWLVDPLGNLMMRYPPDADPSRIRKDMTRLLKYSRIG
jgi:hypothetical protein